MKTKYFRWLFDSKYKGDPWFIDKPRLPSGEVIDAWTFGKCLRISPPYVQLSAPVRQGSERTPAHFGVFDIVYVRAAMAEAISSHAGEQVQLIPVNVEKFDEELSIVNVLNKVRCVDETRSTFQKFLPGNTVRPDKVGEYELITKLYIDPQLVRGLEIFRPWGWTVAIIVSELMKRAIEEVGSQGTRFVEV